MLKNAGPFSGVYFGRNQKMFRVFGAYQIATELSTAPSMQKFYKGVVIYNIVDQETKVTVTEQGSVSLRIVGDVWSIGTFEDGIWMRLHSEPFYTILTEVKYNYYKHYAL